MRPNQVLLFIIAVMVCLGALCMVLPGRVAWRGHELRGPTLAEVTGTEAETSETSEPSEVSEVSEESENPEGSEGTEGTKGADSVPTQEPVVIPKIQIDSTLDSRIYLRAFYASLPEAAERVVRVLHYGDSQIEEDRMTLQIREHLQARFGGTGVGLMPLAQTIPSRTVRQELYMNRRKVNPYHGPQRYLSYASREMQRADGKYGVMSQMALMADSLVPGSEDITAVCIPQTASAHYTRWQVFADSSVHYTFSGDTVRLQGRGAVYGLSQECERGIIVDNIPMRGCLGLVFTKTDSAQLADFYSSQNVRLIIMQFGGNAIPFNEKPGTIQAIVTGLREQVQYIKSCAPDASILFIGPSDMLRQTEGEWQTYPMVPYMDRLLQKMAQEEEIAYFSLFRWMGGAGSMARWQATGLAGSDGVHFYRSGARKAGNAVAEWILEGIEN